MPDVGSLFDDLDFVELDRDESEKLVEQYREEGQKAMPPPEKRFKQDAGAMDGGGGFFGKNMFVPSHCCKDGNLHLFWQILFLFDRTPFC